MSIKLAPLAPSALRGRLLPSALYAGMATCIGFGIGEIWYLAWGISTVPAYASYPFYYFTGFMDERFLVVFLHSAMTAIAACLLPRGAGKAVQGYLVAVCLHAFVNLGALLYQIGAMGVEVPSYSLFISLLVIAAIFEKLRRGDAKSPPPKESALFSRQ